MPVVFSSSVTAISADELREVEKEKNMRGLKVSARLRLLLVTVWGVVGCAPAQPTGKIVATVPAKGVLLYQGKPLPFHSVLLAPEKDRSAIGMTDKDGQFVLGTNRPNDGAVPGSHRVAINYVGNPEDDPMSKGLVRIGTTPPPPKVKIDKKYQSPDTSGVVVEIPPGGTDAIQIELK
ncbi:hypothetical protein [Schlesneria paludicola]|uniref:hypothetical protein n=1 Tax=Schlesneria paludicola TaxID=360056 RepID=UPI00029A253A|nr:hypothetical protein [Schlesneria paludicola]